MAALSTSHVLLTKQGSIHHLSRKKSNTTCPRLVVLVACQTPEPVDTSNAKTNKEEKGKIMQLFSQLGRGAEKLGQNLKEKENRSPQQKGDWKDLVLMSISFAVYVYISQMFVCAYFAWMAMPKQSW